MNEEDVMLVAIEAGRELPTPYFQGLVSGMLLRMQSELGVSIVDSWWIAEDERYDRSDNDSAVFVPMGQQAFWQERIRHLAEFPPCTNCGSEHMDTEMCPNIKSECTDCCGCSDHGPVKVEGLTAFNIEFDEHSWEGHLVNDFAQAYELISKEFDKANVDGRRITSIEFTYTDEVES